LLHAFSAPHAPCSLAHPVSPFFLCVGLCRLVPVRMLRPRLAERAVSD
jgi:hypothetical protein